jgi:polysaccharide biosynthesis/export protein
MQNIIRTALATTLIVSVSGCSMLPGSGPREQNIHANSKASSRNSNATLGYEYVVVDLTRDMLPFVTKDVQEDFQTFGIKSMEPPAIRLGSGDVIRVTVFESETGGLFLPDEAGARPGNFVQLPTQRVDQNGRITVPFAGNIQAAGRTPAEVERSIRDRLQERAIEPEISLEIIEQNFSRVSVIGAVREPKVIKLNEGGLRVLEAISSAGSISGPASSAFVVLQRGNQNVKVAYRNITSNSSENIFLAPGDVIEVVEEEKGYFAFGATGLVGKFNFGAEEVKLTMRLLASQVCKKIRLIQGKY